MKKRIFTTLAVFLSLALVTGCNNKPAEEQNNDETPTSEQQVVASSESTNTSSKKHTHKWEQDPDKTNKEATCTEEGIKYEKCECGETRETTVNKKDHNFVADTSKTNVPATCETEGVNYFKCANCTATKEEKVPATGHIFEDNGPATGKVHPEIDNGCNTHAYRFDISEATGWNTPETKWNVKSGDNAQASWALEEGQLPAGKYKVYLEAVMSYTSHGNRYLFNENKEVHPKNPVTGEDFPDQSSSDPDTATQSPWRYYFSVNNGADIYPDASVTLGELGYLGSNDGGSPKFALVLSEITIPEGATSFEARHGNIGYSLIVSRVRLVEIKAA